MVHATQNELLYLRLSNLAKLAALTEDEIEAKRAVQCRTSEGWEGNRRSVVALAMRYRLHCSNRLRTLLLRAPTYAAVQYDTLVNGLEGDSMSKAKAKAKASGLRGQDHDQGQISSRPKPRPRFFVLEPSSRSRTVLDDPIRG